MRFKARKSKPYQPPRASRRIYLRLKPEDQARFKFLLEACDNLGYLSVVDRCAAVLKLSFAPGQEAEVERFLGEAADFGLCLTRLPEIHIFADGNDGL